MARKATGQLIWRATGWHALVTAALMLCAVLVEPADSQTLRTPPFGGAIHVSCSLVRSTVVSELEPNPRERRGAAEIKISNLRFDDDHMVRGTADVYWRRTDPKLPWTGSKQSFKYEVGSPSSPGEFAIGDLVIYHADLPSGPYPAIAVSGMLQPRWETTPEHLYATVEMGMCTKELEAFKKPKGR